MDKLLETSLGRWSELVFGIDGRPVTVEELGQILLEECNNYQIYKQGGVIVHMTRKEYEEIQRKK